jgi:hypothetical protein
MQMIDIVIDAMNNTSFIYILGGITLLFLYKFCK